jgi:hypothetical protein
MEKGEQSKDSHRKPTYLRLRGPFLLSNDMSLDGRLGCCKQHYFEADLKANSALGDSFMCLHLMPNTHAKVSWSTNYCKSEKWYIQDHLFQYRFLIIALIGMTREFIFIYVYQTVFHHTTATSIHLLHNYIVIGCWCFTSIVCVIKIYRSPLYLTNIYLLFDIEYQL